MTKQKYFFLFLVCLILLDMRFNFYFNKGILGQAACATGLFGVSVLIGLVVLGFYYRKQVVLNVPDSGAKKSGYINLALLLAGMGGCR